MKKPGLLLVVGLLVFLTACMPSADSGKKTLTFWHIGVGEERTILEEAVKRFEKKHPDVKVEIVVHQNDGTNKLPVAMGGGILRTFSIPGEEDGSVNLWKRGKSMT